MQPVETIQNSLDYIEDHLKTELSAQELAELAGYSQFHFERLFKRLVGLPPMRYIQRRRLLHAAFEIADGEKVIDTALNYGFDTQSGFSRAFLREFGASAKAYTASHTIKRPYRIQLLQEEHILITKQTIQGKLSNWGLQDATIAEQVNPNTGVRLDNVWAIGRDYMLKVGTNLVGLQMHIAVSKALREAGFSVSLPVPTLDGREFVTEGELYYYLSRKLNGTVLKTRTLFAPGGEALAYQLGQAIGRLDMALAGFDLPVSANDLPLQMKQWGIPKARAICNLDEAFYRELTSKLEHLWPQLPKQMIHRDLNPGNVLVQGGTITGFLDFDLAERNARIYDPCYAATAILSEAFTDASFDRSLWPSLLRAILAGSDAIVHLTEAERAAIPYIIDCIQITCIAWFSGLERYKELAELNVKMLKWMIPALSQLD